ncbi:MAG: hypothetical protein IKC06_05740, partial [Clostridia bacterium]|nr:hypothetical protein [Clostridia bacterium]
MGKKIFSLFLASLMLLYLGAGMSGCKETPADYSGEDSGITFVLDKTDFSVNTLNLPLTNQDIALFDRFYTIDGEATAFVGGDHTGRTLVTVRYNPSYNEFTVLAIDNSEGEKAETLIPVNGFVASIPNAMLEG